MLEPLIYESHSHTPLCRHSEGEPEEYAAIAEQRGLAGLTVTCHSPAPSDLCQAGRMSLDQFTGEYREMVERAREAWAGRVDVRLGLESDYFPGYESFTEKLHDRMPLSYVLGSVHPFSSAYKVSNFIADTQAYREQYYEHLAASAESGLYDALAHPDLIKNYAPDEWDFERMRPFVLRVLDRIAATGIAMELNTSGVNKSYPEMNPGLPQLQLMQERGIPVVIGADAHVPTRVADGYEEALEMLQAVGYQEVSFFLDRKRQTVTIEAALGSLKAG